MIQASVCKPPWHLINSSGELTMSLKHIMFCQTIISGTKVSTYLVDISPSLLFTVTIEMNLKSSMLVVHCSFMPIIFGHSVCDHIIDHATRCRPAMHNEICFKGQVELVLFKLATSALPCKEV